VNYREISVFQRRFDSRLVQGLFFQWIERLRMRGPERMVVLNGSGREILVLRKFGLGMQGFLVPDSCLVEEQIYLL